MELATLEKVEQLALKKRGVYLQSKRLYIMRAILAGMFIGFGVIVSFKSGSFFYNVDSPLAYPIAALTFSTAIILITYAGGDLFTGNTFYFTYTSLRKKISWLETIKLWIINYSGNFIGAILFALLIWATGLFESATANGFLLSVVKAKTSAPVTQLFFRAILCNWLVSLAFYIPMSMKQDGAKLFAKMLFVFAFFISGYEHSIANMGTFAIAFITNEPDAITIASALHNLIPVTLGNIIGGSFFMGWLYYYLNKSTLEQQRD
ncbi:formate/nitrite transporter family protein [Paenibacillus yanchengensis]|uniref:Formate/nitrite transporter family protein n=1 Tax=Paenibacillus yanchengensis TaxID=2035833 RepID=A0ABW4YH51_9BACL